VAIERFGPESCEPDGRLHFAVTERNRGPIIEVLQKVLAPGLVLEIASGTGQHAVHFAATLPGQIWQPSDPDPAMRASIAAWRRHAALSNVLEPLALDAESDWQLDFAPLALAAINLIHIAPWSVCCGLMRNAGRLLAAGGQVVLYGPYRREGRDTAPSNRDFDALLKAEDPAWGVRDLEAVRAEAASHGLVLTEVVEMPANNLMPVFRKTPAT
jgi:SAM-dependent methyltransferase